MVLLCFLYEWLTSFTACDSCVFCCFVTRFESMDKEELVDVRIPAPSPDEVSDDDEKVAKDLLLEGKRRDSIPGLKPSPMPGVNLFSRYVSYW